MPEWEQDELPLVKTPEDVFAKIAKNVACRYRGIAEADDIEQELWVWWLSHEQPDLSEMDWAMTRTLYTVAERYCKREKSARVIDPKAAYTDAEVMEVLELLVNPPTDKTDTVAAEAADVLTAVANLPDELRAPLVAHAAGEPYRLIADRYGLSVSTAHRRVQQALYAVTTVLNGEA